MAKIDRYLTTMIESGGTALHIGSGRVPMFRLRDDLNDFGESELAPEQVAALLREICPEEAWRNFQTSHDLDFTYDLKAVARFRCNLFFDRSGIGAVLHYIPAQVPTLDDLEAPQILKDICHLPGGLVLVCGAAGSGTTTTQAAMIEYINANTARYIVSITSLVEFTHKADRSIIEQCEVAPGKTAETLAAALDSHPDVLVLDQLPDAKSIRLALRAAMMGILVIAALPTGNFAKTIDYIIDAFPPVDQGEARTLLAESIQAVLPQVKCRANGGGRVVCREILLRAEGVPTAIREGNLASLRQIMDTYRAQGMRTLDFSLRELLAAGKISADEAYARATDKKQFQHFLAGH
ncbi:MAG: ATPase, T2SS/T4P/T4SS family [Victivallaceae bacterium]|nr:ATPase, T2SS/T4P/T4SS family [Victivallaceae bacterium]